VVASGTHAPGTCCTTWQRVLGCSVVLEVASTASESDVVVATGTVLATGMAHAPGTCRTTWQRVLGSSVDGGGVDCF
jgi:hypothetical protein